MRSPPLWLILPAGTALAAALALLSIAFGSTFIPIPDVLKALEAATLPTAEDGGVAAPIIKIVVDLRAPRLLLAMLVGAGLAVVGALLQTVSRNDLADPFLFGLSSGAAAGAVTVITVSGDRFGIWTLPLAALAGGLLSAMVVLLLVTRHRGEGPERLILAGLAVSFLFSALTNVLVFAGDQRAAHSVLFWSLGGLGLARWQNLPLATAGVALVFAFAGFRHRQLDALLAGEDAAESLGVSVASLRLQTFVIAAIATAVLVSLAGVIGFVGLIVPHLARAVAGVRHLPLLTTCAVIGVCLLLASDLASRIILAPQELPVGIVTASIGGAFVIWLVLRRTI